MEGFFSKLCMIVHLKIRRTFSTKNNVTYLPNLTDIIKCLLNTNNKREKKANMKATLQIQIPNVNLLVCMLFT